MSQTPTKKQGFLFRHKRALLGAVASVMIVGGLIAGPQVTPFTSAPALAQLRQEVRPTGFADVVERVKPAVVAIQVRGTEQPRRIDRLDRRGLPDVSPDDPLYRFFKDFRDRGPGGRPGSRGDDDAPAQDSPRMSLGSGFFVSADGYIVTNYHVVKDGGEFTVVTDAGKRLTAKLVGSDERTDLAVLKVSDGTSFPFVKLSEQQPRVGDWVVAIGNPFGLGGTVTAGIVSARGRDIGSDPYNDYIQIDAPVNRGNSGGPTFNLDGEVIGINTAIYSPTGGSVGIGFAIPASVAAPIVSQIQASGTVTRGWLGVQIQSVTEEIAKSLGLDKPEGAIVADTQPNSPAAKAGIHSQDVILAVNGEPVHDSRELTRMVANLTPGSTAHFDVFRRGQRQTIDVQIGKLGEQQQASVNPSQSQQNAQNPASVASLGLTLAPVREGDEGVLVQRVDPRGPAAQQGIRSGDVIVDVGGEPVSSPADVTRALTAARDAGRSSVLARIRSRDQLHLVPLPVGRS